MTFRIQGEWTSFDIQTDQNSNSFVVATNAYATLVAIDGAGKVVPYLAESWEASPTSIRFTLRDDATCGDGTRVTPTVVANSFKRLFATKTTRLLTSFGGGPFSVTADDPRNTFTVNSETPYGDRIYAFASQGAGVICPAGLSNPDALKTQVFGAGPYKLVEAIAGDRATLKLREDFNWGPNGITAKTVGLPETIVYKLVANETTAANLLITGGLDAAVINGPDIDRLLTEKELNNVKFPNFGVTPMIFNHAPGHPTADIAVRKALSTAIDPKAWGSLGLGGHFTEATSFLSRDSTCYDPETTKLIPAPSVEQARQILLDAGWTLSGGKLVKNGQPLVIDVLASTTFPGTGEYMLEQFEQVGITVNLNNTDRTTWGLDSLAGKFDVSYRQNNRPVPIPGEDNIPGFLTSTPLTAGGTGNYSSVVDPVLSEELALARATSGEESCRHWAAFQQRVLKQYHLFPLVVAANYAFTAKDIDLSLAGVACPPLVVPFPCGLSARRVR